MSCDSCESCVTIESDHRDYPACDRIHPISEGIIYDKYRQEPPYWCPKKYNIDMFKINFKGEWLGYQKQLVFVGVYGLYDKKEKSDG